MEGGHGDKKLGNISKLQISGVLMENVGYEDIPGKHTISILVNCSCVLLKISLLEMCRNVTKF